MAKSSAELKKELIAAEERERNEARAAREKTPPQFEYWMVPAVTSTTSLFSKLYDPTCLLYELRRTVTNKDDALAAGWQEDEIKEGSATYIYNIVTRRVICAVGGGTVYINRTFGMDEDYADDTAMFAIGGFLAEYPGGGEITAVVADFKATRRNKQNGQK